MPSGVFKRSPEHIANIKKANTGLKRSEETRKRISESKKGKPQVWKSPEHRAQAMANRKAGMKRGKDHHFFGKGAPLWALAKISATHTGVSYKVCRENGIDPDFYRAQLVSGRFWCGLCKSFLPEDERAGNTKSRTQCKKCSPAYQRAVSIKRKFGVDAEWYERKLAEQGMCCAICKSPDKLSKNGFLAIDHSHTSNSVRGLVCTRCNVTVGLIESSVYLACLEYLRSYGETGHLSAPLPSVVA